MIRRGGRQAVVAAAAATTMTVQQRRLTPTSILMLAARAGPVQGQGEGGRRGIHTWYSISTSGVTRVR